MDAIQEILILCAKSWVTKSHEETSGVKGYVHYFDDEDGFINVYLYQNSSNYIF